MMIGYRKCLDDIGDTLVLWLLGFIAHIGGGLIHIILVVAVIVLVIKLITGGRAA